MQKSKTLGNLISLFVVLILGTVFHFVYDFIGKPYLSSFFPINESVFEHGKLFVYPFVLVFFVLGLIRNVSISRICKAVFVSVVLSYLLMISFFYSYTTFFSLSPIIMIDILSFYVIATISFFVGLNIFSKNRKSSLIYVVLLLFLLFVISYLTIFPPNFPLFQELTESSLFEFYYSDFFSSFSI